MKTISNTSETAAGHTAGKMHFTESTSGQYRIFADGFAQAEVYPTMRPGAKRTEMAARIVLAVNCHDQLVSALRLVVDHMGDSITGTITGGDWNTINAALAAAEGGGK